MEMSPLFCSNGALSEFLARNARDASEAVKKIPEAQFQASTDEQVVEHIYARFSIEPLVLHRDSLEMDAPEETQVDVSQDPRRSIWDRSRAIHIPGSRITIRAPFEGDPRLWRLRPSCYTMDPPRAKVEVRGDSGGGFLVFEHEVTADAMEGAPARLREELDRTLNETQKTLNALGADVAVHNRDLRACIEGEVERRRERLGRMAELTEQLGIPMKRNPDAPDLTRVPMEPKLVKPLPSPQKRKEWSIRDEDYAHILKIIRHEGRSFETTPSTLAKLGEEDIRNIILAHLNGHYEGGAKGEAFRKKGKTDLLVEFENRSAFVAECKMWGGPGTMKDAISQLLGYLTWRDCKAALVLFNKKTKGFKAIQGKVKSAAKEHPNFLKALPHEEPDEWRFLFRSDNDEEREVVLHVFLFNFYAES